MKITPAILYAIAPAAKPEFVADMVEHWPDLQRKYGLNDADVPHSLAHIAAETGGFNRLEESLYYTTTKRLRQVWPSRFKTDAAAAPFVRAPEKLANLVYGGRLGNTHPNDGWLYRGSGCKQTTGKTNFKAVQDATGIACVAAPHLLRAFPVALESAFVYWRDNRLSRIVAAGGDVVAKLTKAIQGGTGGLADRRTYTARALAAVNGSGVAVSPPQAMLRHGSSGPKVTALQTRLNQLGYDVGRIDGAFGDSTERAVRDFQRDNGLIADGVAGPVTVKALNASPGRAKVPPSAEPSGMDQFIAWLISLFTRA